MLMDRLRISSKLQLAFAVLIIAFLTSSGVVFTSIERINAAADRSDSSLVRSRQAENLLTLILEQTNALRGYVVKADPKFLATYQETKIASTGRWIRWTRHRPTRTRRPRPRRCGPRWSYGVKTWATRWSPDGVPGDAGAGRGFGRVKSLMTLRSVEKEIRANADAAAAAGQKARARSAATGLYSIVLGGLGAIGIAAVMGWLLSRTIAKPVSQLTDVMHRLARGDHDIVRPACRPGRAGPDGRRRGRVQGRRS